MRELMLFMTDSCSLCETALDLVAATPLGTVGLTLIDIADDSTLLERYGETIPVVRCGGDELVWPFTSEELMGLVSGRTPVSPADRR